MFVMNISYTIPNTHAPPHVTIWTILKKKKTIISTCDNLDTDYNSDNQEPGFLTIFVT